MIQARHEENLLVLQVGFFLGLLFVTPDVRTSIPTQVFIIL
jgi:hypothetical protein